MKGPIPVAGQQRQAVGAVVSPWRICDIIAVAGHSAIPEVLMSGSSLNWPKCNVAHIALRSRRNLPDRLAEHFDAVFEHGERRI